MTQPTDSEEMPRVPSRRRRYLARTAIGGAVIVVAAFGAAWFSRIDIADGIIRDTLAEYDLPASYDITSIGAQRQVIDNVVIGDPANPDMTVERAVVTIRYRFGMPVIGEVLLVKPRLYGRLVDGRVSFGALDRVFYAEGTDEPFRLPDMRVAIDDGRALVRSEYGNVGVKVAGQGALRNGFSGVIGAVAPDLSDGDCTARDASLYGKVTISGEQPQFEGPLRLGGIDCDETDLSLGKAMVSLDLTGSEAFDAFRGKAKLLSGRLAASGQSIGSIAGDVALSYGKEGLNTDIDLTGADASIAGATLTRMGLDGALRAREGFANVAFDGSFSGVGLRPGRGLNDQLRGYEGTAAGTLLEPLLAKMRGALAGEGSRSTIDGEVQARIGPARKTVIIPHAQWQGTSGQMLLTLSRAQMTLGDGSPRFAGHFETGGQGMPRMAGRMEQGARGQSVMQLSLAEYAAGDAKLAIPAMTITQDASGGIALDGDVRASGAIPGGNVRNLRLPVSGGWRQRQGLALWPGCVTPTFDRLELASLTLQNQSLMVCSPKGSAILRSDDAGTRFAGGVPELDLSGMLGDTPATIRGGPVGLGIPGTLVARDLDITLGTAETATEFHLSELVADIGRDISGRFADAEFRLAAVPLDMTQASGEWAWRDGGLTVTNGALRVTDRQADARFQPMVARDATLRFADNRIIAEALLREETTDRAIVDVDIVHDLSSGTGHADLDVPGITFDNRLQPDTVTRLALGTIANAEGTVTGKGRIDWNEAGVTSTGTFSTDSLDFAAAFGPVRGLSGTVEFTDLLGLVTAPNQKVRIAEINPGIVVNDGVVDFQIGPELALSLNDTTFPFMGGTLTMRPTRMNLGVTEVRSYVFEIEGLDAARFVERMELANLQATGTFDGTIPLIFDENGGRIEGGVLNSRPPGGNVSYVGALTYEDISPIANFAFDALKSLDYTAMRIGLDGSLEGEIVTRVKIDGVKQGEGAKRNIITRRLASLPIRFDVNVRAPFMQLLSSFKSLYDPASVRDPRELGLIGVEGNALVPSGEVVRGQDITPVENTIQPSESE
ncbi:YdbH domain-containing protein [Croceicoccus bisphenolivorans]|uniref:YdbH domain-containing protein n=1 Tax=Croceicoccus bisphenolivorans TaxID=1783232 RepID=UPI0009ECE34C|nr:YdbH domain-containing protein [Croceicoccus bisphenolivorans]